MASLFFEGDFNSGGTRDYNGTVTATACTTFSFDINYFINWLPIDETQKIIDEYKMRLKLYKKSLFKKSKISPTKSIVYHKQNHKIFIPTKKDWRGIESWN